MIINIYTAKGQKEQWNEADILHIYHLRVLQNRQFILDLTLTSSSIFSRGNFDCLLCEAPQSSVAPGQTFNINLYFQKTAGYSNRKKTLWSFKQHFQQRVFRISEIGLTWPTKHFLISRILLSGRSTSVHSSLGPEK